MLGFSERIVRHEPVRDPDETVIAQVRERTYRIALYKPHEHSIHLQRANGSWQRWARFHHLNDQSDVEAAMQILQGVELG
jgi:hypothetical protein